MWMNGRRSALRRLNPIGRRGGREGQLALLRSVTLAALGRELHPEEDAGVRVALDQVNEEAGTAEPTLPMVVEALLHPRGGDGRLGLRRRDLGVRRRRPRRRPGLQPLGDGDLRGMFDGPPTERIDLDGRLVVLDLSAVRDSEEPAVLMTCAAARQQRSCASARRRPTARARRCPRSSASSRRSGASPRTSGRRVAAGELQALPRTRHRQLRLPRTASNAALATALE